MKGQHGNKYLNNTVNQLHTSNRHLKNTPPKHSRLHIILKCTYKIIQNRIYQVIKHILDHRTSLRGLKSTEIIQSMFSDHNGVIIRN